MRLFIKIPGLFLMPFVVFSQNGYYGRLDKDTLVMGNGVIEKKYVEQRQ